MQRQKQKKRADLDPDYQEFLNSRRSSSSKGKSGGGSRTVIDDPDY